jgi:hypothetical protein
VAIALGERAGPAGAAPAWLVQGRHELAAAVWLHECGDLLDPAAKEWLRKVRNT